MSHRQRSGSFGASGPLRTVQRCFGVMTRVTFSGLKFVYTGKQTARQSGRIQTDDSKRFMYAYISRFSDSNSPRIRSEAASVEKLFFIPPSISHEKKILEISGSFSSFHFHDIFTKTSGAHARTTKRDDAPSVNRNQPEVKCLKFCM